MTIDDPIYKKIKSYDKTIFEFDRTKPEIDFKPGHYAPQKEGMYITIRCGLPGIYQTLDEWKDGRWQKGVLDGSTVIAYSRETISL